MALTPLRAVSGAPGAALRSPQALEDFEQELVDQYALAMAAAGISDGFITSSRATVFEFARSLSGPIWTAGYADGDRFLAEQRRLGRAQTTRAGKAGVIAQFYEFLVTRYLGDIRTATGAIVEQPIDEWNRPSGVSLGKVRVPPSDVEVTGFFERWRASVADARKYLPAARDYFAASLWRRLGLRISESVMLDIRDWRPDLGLTGKLHVRFGKGSRGRGYKPRLIPAINGADALIDWWLAEVRPQFGEDWKDPDAPLLPSERIDRERERPLRVGPNALRRALAEQTTLWLPSWEGRMTPHVLRHYCASSLYGAGMDLKALQELLGHNWLSTTSGYIHVRSEHIENAWQQANARTERRLGGEG
ncbi:tyrosine-type recombinase/integrase [Microbacterium sp. No. 7]|uniref:tyrosine-type recombinase/integrase n=1 Tax=Microbacterium sp. No. 7 TaxID=1714373 RepID=UPI0006D055FE|nr:tyrosine-type recombinase/integrase [Microbacterium sp. No. 7]ALJ20632.1 integrase [Microbacterium sp. No. 7]ALJ20919.1 integrase [Microbacterium sp. No. 7]